MSKLIIYLKSSGSLTVFNRKAKPRFWWLVAVTVVIILGVVFWDKLVPQSFATSIYWKGVL